jgi:Bacterial Ig-like domain (group 3)
MRKFAIVAGAGAVATMTTLALNPFSASAADATTPTTTTVTGPAKLTVGHAVTFVATIAPFKTLSAPIVKATGTVTFTIVGSNSSTVSCSGATSSPALGHTGTASCKVAKGGLTGAGSPYTVTATYSGDGTFIGSSDSISQAVGLATTQMTVSFDPKVASGGATVVTVSLTGSSGLLPTGKVHFAIPTSNAPTKGKLDNCNGKKHDDFQHLSANDTTPTPTAEVTCSLPAGWFNASTTAKTSTWNVEASYDGDANFGQVQVTKTGIVKG